jgi:putative membrane protein
MAFLSRIVTAGVSFGVFLASSGSAIEQEPADARFIREAAQSSIFEIQTGELAQLRSSNDQVKEYGNRMTSDYGTLQDQLKSIAAKYNFVLPDDMGAKNRSIMDLVTEISGPVALSQPAFDQVYIGEMIAAHRTDISAFRTESADGSNPDLRNWAARAIPVMEEHLRLTRAAEDYLGSVSQVVGKDRNASAHW